VKLSAVALQRAMHVELAAELLERRPRQRRKRAQIADIGRKIPDVMRARQVPEMLGHRELAAGGNAVVGLLRSKLVT